MIIPREGSNMFMGVLMGLMLLAGLPLAVCFFIFVLAVAEMD